MDKNYYRNEILFAQKEMDKMWISIEEIEAKISALEDEKEYLEQEIDYYSVQIETNEKHLNAIEGEE